MNACPWRTIEASKVEGVDYIIRRCQVCRLEYATTKKDSMPPTCPIKDEWAS